MNTATALNLVEELRTIADELELELDNSENPAGTIVKAKPEQSRFKTSSLWVSLGNGKYKHLTGKKGLITTHARLDGFVDVVYSA
jgi:hypothetical protein